MNDSVFEIDKTFQLALKNKRGKFHFLFLAALVKQHWDTHNCIPAFSSSCFVVQPAREETKYEDGADPTNEVGEKEESVPIFVILGFSFPSKLVEEHPGEQ